MACLSNYTVQCVDVMSGKIGCFIFDEQHWMSTGEFKAICPVFDDLVALYAGTDRADRKSCYLERSKK